MTLKNSSKIWIQRHINDPFVKAAGKDGFVSRAAYKLIEINKKFRFFQKNSNGLVILDLGCCPGSWIQAIANEINLEKNLLIGVDILPLKNLPLIEEKMKFIQGDIEDEKITEEILKISNGKKIDLILSDISHNNIGDPETDRIICERIIENIFGFAKKNLKSKGNFICKAIKGADSGEIFKKLKGSFEKISRFKPDASRTESSEIYIIAQGFKK